jgi:hypothetical protein
MVCCAKAVPPGIASALLAPLAQRSRSTKVRAHASQSAVTASRARMKTKQQLAAATVLVLRACMALLREHRGAPHAMCGALARKALAAALRAPTPAIVFAPRVKWARLTRPRTAATRACRSAALARRATASWQPPLRPPTAHAPRVPRDNSRAAPPTRSARSGRRAPRARACRAPALLLPTAAAPRAMSARPTRLRTTATRAPA